jgi:hypothetical protein
MARHKRAEGVTNAAPEGEQIDIDEVVRTDTPGLAEVVIEPAAQTAGGHAARVQIQITDLNVITSEGRAFEYWKVFLPEPEANKLIAEGRAKLVVERR